MYSCDFPSAQKRQKANQLNLEMCAGYFFLFMVVNIFPSNTATKLATSGPATIQRNSWDAFFVTPIAPPSPLHICCSAHGRGRWLSQKKVAVSYVWQTHLSQPRNGHWGGFFPSWLYHANGQAANERSLCGPVRKHLGTN